MSVKFCVGCQKVKPLETDYYKAVIGYQKRCKICHNKKRKEYPNIRKPYIPKKNGFQKLPEELQEKIKYDIYVQINFKDIWLKYKDEYPMLKYQTMLRWNRKGKIPEYEHKGI